MVDSSSGRRGLPTVWGGEIAGATVTHFGPDSGASDCDAGPGLAEALLVAAHDMVGVTDADGRIRYVNGAVRRVLGYAPMDMVGTSVFDYIHREEVDDAVASLGSTAVGVDRYGVPLSLRVRSADGTWRAVEVTAANMLDDPAVAGMVFTVRDLTYRGEAELRLRTMFEQSPIPQALIPPGRPRMTPNSAFAHLFATTREALFTTDPATLVHPDDRIDMSEAHAELQAGDTERVFSERRYVRASGEEFVGRSTTSVLRRLDGKLDYLYTTIEDVTLELRAAEALARSEARARALIENSPDIIAVLYPDGQWEASDQGTRLLGYPKGIDPDGGVFSLIHPDDIADAADALQDILAGARPPSTPIDLRLRAADGTYRQFECVGQNLSDDLHVGGVVITARDITERKLADARLRAAEQRFRVAFEHAPLAVSMIDLDGIIIDINAAGCAMLGYERAALIGAPAESTVYPDDRRLAIDMTTAQLGGSAQPAEFRLQRADGQIVFALSHASLVDPIDPDDAAYVITLQTDISDRKQLERELERRASHDTLTGLSNRASLDHHLEHVLARRDGPAVVAIFIDLDNFKTINDSYGHETGDTVLTNVAQCLTDSIRHGDLAARLGGDEFVVICDATRSSTILHEIPERIRTAIATLDSTDGNGNGNHITASIGVAISQPGDVPSALLRRADTAVYIAKRAGKNRVELVTDTGDPAAAPHLAHTD